VPRRIEIQAVASARASDLAHARLDVLFPAIQLATVLVMLAFFIALREGMYGYFIGHVFFLVCMSFMNSASVTSWRLSICSCRCRPDRRG
jgi:hypothetical protein